MIRNGDIVSIDVGATKDGYIGDCAETFVAGEGSEEAKKLIEVTRLSFYEALICPRGLPGFRHLPRNPDYVEKNGFSVVREYVGHGVGSDMHEPPEVPNYVKTPEWDLTAPGGRHDAGR